MPKSSPLAFSSLHAFLALGSKGLEMSAPKPGTTPAAANQGASVSPLGGGMAGAGWREVWGLLRSLEGWGRQGESCL